MNDYQWEVCEAKREEIIEDETARLMDEYLNDTGKFESLESGYEFLTSNAGNIQRCLRNLDDAIKGKEYARDAIFTALGYIQNALKQFCKSEAEEEAPTVESLHEDYCAEQLDARMNAAKDKRLIEKGEVENDHS